MAILPGAEFGRPRDELTARLAYVNFDGQRCLDALADNDDEVDDTFLTTHCAETVEAIERLCKWLCP
ncbi:hypothetical protein [Enhygromyxa salina]|uniref:hypothetical protein n=1 Tax=Enhygromyxa salina TaxID=215803 RepID=UPI001C62F0A8|nr:hypothetical protein [Enhygromyxa salina]